MSDKLTHIVFPVFEGVTHLDFTAPHLVFKRVPSAHARLRRSTAATSNPTTSSSAVSQT